MRPRMEWRSGERVVQDAVQLDTRLGRGGVRREAQQGQVVERAGRSHLEPGPGKGLEEVRASRPAVGGRQILEPRESERGRQHADDLQRPVIEGDDASQHRRVAAVAALPQPVRQHGDAGALGGSVAVPKEPSEQRFHPQQLEEAGQDARSAQWFGRSVAGSEHAGGLQRRELPAGRLAGPAPRIDRAEVHVPERKVLQLGDD